MARESTSTTGPPSEHALDALIATSGRAGAAVRLVPLVLVALPLVDFLLADPPAERIASLVPAVVLFMAIVLWTLLAPVGALARRALVATVLLTTLAAVVLLIDPAHHWLVLFYYPAAAAGLLMSTRRSSVAIVGVAIAITVPAWFLHPTVDGKIEHPVLVLVIGFASLAVARLVIVNQQLAQARAEIAGLAAAHERLRIARDLHDLLGQGLSVISLKAQLASRLLPGDPARAAIEVAEIGGVARQALEDVRAAVGGYRRLRLDDELVGARVALEAAGVKTEMDHRAGTLPGDIDEAFAWSVREGATNIIRHAQARKTVIRTRREERTAVLDIVNDDARPASATSVPSVGQTGAGSGLAGLAERTLAIGGHLEAGPQPDGGFRLTVIVPFVAGSS